MYIFSHVSVSIIVPIYFLETFLTRFITIIYHINSSMCCFFINILLTFIIVLLSNSFISANLKAALCAQTTSYDMSYITKFKVALISFAQMIKQMKCVFLFSSKHLPKTKLVSCFYDTNFEHIYRVAHNY